VAAEPKLGLDPPLHADQAQLLQALGLPACEVLVAELPVGSAAPERKRAPEQRGGKADVPALERLPAFGEQTLEPGRVECLPRQLERVAGAARLDARARR
jgi:hypothetical protein